jgi:7-cyano-7-deazaguanine synthase in queuosine biosynthesis
MNNNNDKKHLVVWSGGLDSTNIILQLIRDNKPFDTIYFNLLNNKNKTICEKYTRNKIRNLLISKHSYLKDTWTDYDNTSTLTIDNINTNHYYCSYVQGVILMFNLVNFISSKSNIYSHVYMGYIKGDDYWYYKTELENIYQNLFRTIENYIKLYNFTLL